MSEPRDQNRFLVRMPDGMRDRIADIARSNNRSMNSEIVARLEASLTGGADTDADKMLALIKEALHSDVVGSALKQDKEVLAALEVAGRDVGIPARLASDTLHFVVTNWLIANGYLENPLPSEVGE